MPVIGGNTPTVNVTVPVPTPVPMKKPRPQPQPAPQPVPADPQSQQQAIPQGMVPPQPQQPEPTAIILPWAPPPPTKRQAMRKMRVRKYAADDPLSFDFDSMGDDQLPREEHQRPAPKEDITGRRRRQILLQMLEAAKKGNYDSSGMTPREVIQDMETPPDVPQGGGDVFMSDPEDEEPEKKARIEYPKHMARATPESTEALFDAVGKNPSDESLKHALADELEQSGRSDEANHLRSGKPFSFQLTRKGIPGHFDGTSSPSLLRSGDARRVVPAVFSTAPAETALNHVENHLNDISNGEYSNIGGLGDWDILRSNKERHQYRAEDFYEPEEYNRRIPKGHVRVIQMQEDEPHSMTDVHYNDLGAHLADMVDEVVSRYGDDWFHPNEPIANDELGAEYDRRLTQLAETPGHTGLRGT